MDFHPRCWLKGNILCFLTPPLHCTEIKAIIVLQNAAHPQTSRILQCIETNPLTVEVGRLFDSTPSSFDHITVAETAVRERGNGGKIPPLVVRHQIPNEGQLAHIELFVAEHTPVALRRLHGHYIEIETGGLDDLLP